jgi:hypothetical protein
VEPPFLADAGPADVADCPTDQALRKVATVYQLSYACGLLYEELARRLPPESRAVCTWRWWTHVPSRVSAAEPAVTSGQPTNERRHH